MKKSNLKHQEISNAVQIGDNSRRSFLKKAAVATLTIANADTITFAQNNPINNSGFTGEIPWYRRVTRWGQTNITEKDPDNYDIAWWRKHWKETQTQGVIINAGGIVAYYPSKVPLHRQAQYLKGRDLFGDLCRAAHEEGLVVFARMDSNRAHEEFYQAHPDWFAIDANGKPYKAGDLFITCVNSPYYNEHIPSILTEVSKLYHPEGFTDNSWSGLGRESICYCENCNQRFREKTGKDIPRNKNWDDQVYRHWIRWNYDRRLEIWDMNNQTTKLGGGPTCIWSGMNSSSINGQSKSFRDYKEICRRADIIMLDSQARSDTDGFQQNSDTGKLIHGLLGWEKLIPESMAMYQAGKPTFRLACKPVAEARMWMIEGIAGGIQPWWHYVGASHVDKQSATPGKSLRKWAGETYHTYLRLTPELRKNVDGPNSGFEPRITGVRHRVLKGFEETDILGFGGLLESVKTDPRTEVLMTFIPQFPIYPPETAWMREPKTEIPGLILNTASGGSRIAFMPADIDRQFARYNLPDHGNLLANLIRWAAKDKIPLFVECAGLIDCNLYRQSGWLILHLVNLTSAGTWRQPVDEYIPIGPAKVRIQLPEDVTGKSLMMLVSGQKISGIIESGWITFTVSTILDHEVVVVT